MASPFIPTGEPVLDGKEKKYVSECFRTNWISHEGNFVKKFEESFARFLGVKYAVFCSSGTAAIHLALRSSGVGPGDEVVIPDFTIISSATSVIYCGAKPVLVDADSSWCLDPKKIEEKITKKTRAIMAVHIYGNPANMKAIKKIAKKHRLLVIEDACAAIGAKVNNQLVGSLGDVGCFSFYATKTITCGEGGMLTTNDKLIADKAKLLRNQGFEKVRFIHKELGFSYRTTNIQAAIGLAQLEKAREKIDRKRQIAGIYTELLREVKGITLQADPVWGKSSFWMFSIVLDDSLGIDRDEMMEILKKKGIGTERFFLPMSQQPVFKNQNNVLYPDISGFYPRSQELGRKGLYLPSGLNVTLAQQKKVVKELLSLCPQKSN